MPKRTLPAALATALTIGLAGQPEPVRARQEPVFTVKDMYYAGENGLTAETDEDFLKHAYRFCAIDIETAKLAIARTSNSEVRTFAERLVNDNTAISKALAEWAARKNVGLKDGDPTVKMRLDKHKFLQAMTGVAFDRAFLRAILDHHADGIHLLTNEQRNTQDAGLRAFAAETRPKLTALNNVARPLLSKVQ